VLRSLALMLCVSCTCGPEAEVSEDRVLPRLAPAMPPAAGRPASTPRQPAPQRSLWGLELGTTQAEGIETWIQVQELDCDAAPATRRMTYQYRCMDADLSAEFTGRTPGSARSTLLLARTDSGPLHHVSTLRHHGAAGAAIQDYQTAIAQITLLLGDPTAKDPLPPTRDHFLKDQARFATRWEFSDLEVGASLYKMGGEDVVMRERWDVRGVEAGVPPRPGTVGHSTGGTSGPHSPHGIVPSR